MSTTTTLGSAGSTSASCPQSDFGSGATGRYYARVSRRWSAKSLVACRRAIRTALLGALGLGAVSCKLLELVFEEPPPLPAKHPTQDLVIERGVASFNGNRIAPGVPLSRWVELFGEPDRVKGQYHLWDRLGLGAGSIDQASDEARPKLLVDC